MRALSAMIAACVLLPLRAAAQEAPASQRLVFEETGADTASCGDLHIQFLGVRGDPVFGNGLRVMVRNRTTARLNFDPTRFKAQLKSGRQVSFLSAPEVASQYLDPFRTRAMESEERERVRRDIENDPRLRSGPVSAGMATEKFLSLGWSRAVGGEPASLLPLRLFCGREPLGRIAFAPEQN